MKQPAFARGCAALAVSWLAWTTNLPAAAPAAEWENGLRQKAAVWLEAEDAQAGERLQVDERKAKQASGGKVLGMHADQGVAVTARWSLQLAAGLKQPALLIRHAGIAETRIEVALGERVVGTLTLPQTAGWGGAAGDWQWTMVPLPSPVAAAAPTLALTASSPINLDCLALAETGNILPANLQIAKLTETKRQALKIKLGAWQAPSDGEAVGAMDSSREGRIFLDEELPALLTRTLGVSGASLPPGGVQWIFTGPRAGLTVAIKSNGVELFERYYDSFGLHPEGTTKFARFPEAKRSVFAAQTEGTLQAVTLSLDHRASVELRLNGELAYRGTFVEDVSRHQLRLPSGTNELAWRMWRPSAKPASVTVAPERAHQKILGWGGITSMPSYRLLSEAGRRQWWKFLCEYGLNIQREYPAGRTLKPDYANLGSLQAAIHHYYDDNFPNGETVDFDYLRLHRLLPQSAVWFEYWWQLPPWTVGKPDEYAKSIMKYCRRVKEKTGRGPEIIGVQNEHLDAQWAEQAKAIRTQLDAAGLAATRIHMNDNGRMDGGLKWLQQYRGNAEAWRTIDYTATHQYDYQKVFTEPDKFDATLLQWQELGAGKPYLSTELCVNSPEWQYRSYRLAFQMAQQYHKTLTLADAAAVCYCWLLLDVEQPTFNWTRTLFAVDRENAGQPVASSHQLRCYGAYSRRVAPGMTRVETQCANSNLLATAFQNDAGQHTLVLINRATEPLEISVQWPKAKFTALERVSHLQPNLAEPFAGAAKVSIAPGAIVTLTDVPPNTLPESFWREFEKERH